MEQLVSRYIESKRTQWSESTLKSERARLSGLTKSLLQDPVALWDYLTTVRGLAPYATRTAYTRVISLLDFALFIEEPLEVKGNVLRVWRANNGARFKNVYTKKQVGITFEEARERINSMPPGSAKDKALQLLVTGMRFTESTTLDKDGVVLGKGSKRRHVALGNEYKPKNEVAYHTLRRRLKPLGLTPHLLRKLCATKMVELGAKEADLLSLFGWSSMQVAAIYVQAQQEKELVSKMREVVK